MSAFGLAGSDHRDGALEVWRAANVARGNPPSVSRVARVSEKLRDPAGCLVVGVESDHVVAMALAEAGREGRGQGPVISGLGHVSMVFVDPERWGHGIGAGLLGALHHEMLQRGWRTASLWTRSSNGRARRLYERWGYRDTGEVARLFNGEQILRYELGLGRIG